MLTQRETSKETVLELLNHVLIPDGSRILEPSAGIGNVAKEIRSKYPNSQLDCVELNKVKRETLKNKGFNVVGADYFLYKPKELYDYIIALPNFKDNVDCDHVIKMYEDLKPGGEIVSLMSPKWIKGNSERQLNFKEWLKDKIHYYNDLKNNPFKENGEKVPCIIIKVYKQ